LGLECPAVPDAATVNMLELVRNQIVLQGIDLEVVVLGGGGCGPSCACAE
jgi:hypothetical protein